MSETLKILFLAANPKDTGQLRLDEEIREIKQVLLQAEFRDKFEIEQEFAVRTSDIQAHLLRHKPHIVHFSGHGSEKSEIILEDKTGNSTPLSVRALSQLFSVLKDNIRCVVLNACYSEPQAQAIAKHVDCVIGMSKAIGDPAAISFSVAFYQALGFGRDIKTAFDLGCLQIDLENLNEHVTPKLLALNINPQEIIIVRELLGTPELRQSPKNVAQNRAGMLMHTLNEKPRVFISHAWEDKHFIQQLEEGIKAVDIDVWVDHSEVRAGDYIAKSVNDAIEWCNTLLLVWSQAASASVWVEREWGAAFSNHKKIIPCLLDDTKLPQLLTDTAYVDFRNFSKGITQLIHTFSFAVQLDTDIENHQNVHSVGKLVGVPELPPFFVSRHDEVESLKSLLFAARKQQVGIFSRSGKVGVQGMGGVGKTIVAIELALETDVRMAFPDGIYWLTLGQQPNLTVRQGQLVESLCGQPRAFVDVQQGRAHLSELLAEKKCLIILDDVWQVEHLTAFTTRSPSCAMVITSRNTALAPIIGGLKLHLDVLRIEQAMTLLSNWAAQPLDQLPTEAYLVAQECGNLPLALAMVGAIVRERPDRWSRVLHNLRMAELERIGRQLLDYPYPDLLRAIQISIEALAPHIRARYLDLAIFQEDVPIPESVLCLLWQLDGLSANEAKDVIDVLVERSLAFRDSLGRINLHDLQFDYLRGYAHKVGALVGLHDRLLGAYSSCCQDHRWPTGPADGYFFEHLAYHLFEAGREDELRHLLLDFEWQQAKLNSTDVNKLIADYDFFPQDQGFALVQSAIRLSAHVLHEGKSQLGEQLIGRLIEFSDAQLQTYISQIKQRKVTPWLRPLTAIPPKPGGPVLRILSGHNRDITAIAVSGDGKLILSGSEDCTVRIWDLDKGEVLSVLEGHQAPVRAVAVTTDRQTAISASDDSSIIVWNIGTGKRLKTLLGHTKPIRRLAITQDRRYIVSSSEDATVRVWQLDNGLCQSIYQAEVHIFMAVPAFDVTSDGRLLLSSGSMGVQICGLANGEPVRNLPVDSWGPITSIKMLPNGQRALISSTDESGWQNSDSNIWDIERGEILCRLPHHNYLILDVAISPDNRYAFVDLGYQEGLEIWDLDDCGNHSNYGKLFDISSPFTITLNGELGVSGSGSQIKIWSVDRALKYLDHRYKWTGNEIIMSADGFRAMIHKSRLDFGYPYSSTQVWDVSRQLMLAEISGDGIGHSAMSRDGRVLVIASGYVDDAGYERGVGLIVQQMDRPGEQYVSHSDSSLIDEIVVSLDGRRALARQGSVLVMSNLDTYEVEYEKHDPSVKNLTLTPEGTFGSVMTSLTSISFREIESDRIVKSLPLQQYADSIESVRITSDGYHAILILADRSVRIVHIQSERQLFIMTDFAQEVKNGPIWITNGGWLISAPTTCLQVWDLTARKMIAYFIRDNSGVFAATPDGRTIIWTDSIGQIQFLHLENI